MFFVVADKFAEKGYKRPLFCNHCIVKNFLTEKLLSNTFPISSRISDRGGGIPHHLVGRVLEYNFTTANKENMSDPEQQEGVFSNMMEAVNPNPAGGPMHG